MDSLARHINDNSQPAALARLSDKVGGDELGDGLGQIDTVDKDVNCRCQLCAIETTHDVGICRSSWVTTAVSRTIENLLERTALGSLGHVPFENVLPG